MKKSKKIIISTVAALAIILGCFGIYNIFAENRVASIVLLDVNPSIEIKVNNDEDVVEVNALNNDAEEVLKGMKLKGADVDTAINAIVGSLLKHGYIDELANSILLTVEDQNTVRGKRLQAELTEEINEILSATSVNAAILAQHINEGSVTDISNQYNISKGKAALIQNILEVNNTYEMQDLAQLSVNELNLILSNPKNEAKDIVSMGNANDSAYIGREEAKKAAFTHAGVKESDVRKVEIDFDYEYGKMVYEVDFGSGEYEYDYSIDADSGEVLHSHREYDDDYAASTLKSETAGNAVVGNTGTSEHSGTAGDATDNSGTTGNAAGSSGTSENVAAENSGSTENAATGNDSSSGEKEDIGKEQAKSIALAHAGLSESKVTRLKVERDLDDGRIEYSVEFTSGNKEYDYEIDGTSGKILDYDVETEEWG